MTVRRRPRPRRYGVLGAFLAAVAVVLSACGVGTDTSPNLVASKTVPNHLLTPSSPTTTTAPPSQFVEIYFLKGQRLVIVSRAAYAPVSVRSAVKALVEGPTTAEAATGFQSPISTAAPIEVSHLATPTVDVSVGSTFTSLSGRDQTVAIAQLVFTITAFPEVNKVRVFMNGKPVEVPTANGTIGKGPLTKDQFAAIAPR